MSNYEIGKQALDAIINKKVETRSRELKEALNKKFREILKEFPELHPSGASDISLYGPNRKQVSIYLSWNSPAVSSELADMLFDNVKSSIIRAYIKEIAEKIENL